MRKSLQKIEEIILKIQEIESNIIQCNKLISDPKDTVKRLIKLN